MSILNIVNLYYMLLIYYSTVTDFARLRGLSTSRPSDCARYRAKRYEAMSEVNTAISSELSGSSIASV